MKKRRKIKKAPAKFSAKFSSLNKLLVAIIILEILYFGFRYINNYIYQQKQGTDSSVQCLQEGKRYTIEEAVNNPAACDVEITYEDDFAKLAESADKLQNVQTLYLRKTPETAIPAEIAKLQNLKVLTFHHTFNTSLPREIGLLQNLTDLNFNQADIKFIPAETGNLNNLKNLTIVFNTDKVEIPPEIGRLENLKVLTLSENPGVILPEELSSLTQLEELDLTANNLSEIPEFLTGMQNLKLLNLAKNNLNKAAVESLKSALPDTSVVY